jgi:hypothetical protein
MERETASVEYNKMKSLPWIAEAGRVMCFPACNILNVYYSVEISLVEGLFRHAKAADTTAYGGLAQ